MIQDLFQIMVVGVFAVILISVLKKYSGDLSILLSLITAVLIAIMALRLFRPILTFADEIRELSGLDRELLEPVIKCLGIGLLTQICVNICTDSGQSGIGKMIEISGSVLCLYISLPLFRGVVSLLAEIGGNT